MDEDEDEEDEEKELLLFWAGLPEVLGNGVAAKALATEISMSSFAALSASLS